jgi:hypothetical protein
MSPPMYCTNHPDRETLLRCAKCDQPICTECAIRHPVGLRCPDCARLRKAPTYDVSAPHYLRAFGAGLGASVICSLIVQIVSLSFLYLFAGLIAGGVIAEVISRATSHKRGVGLQIVGGVCVFLGYLFGSLLVTTYRFGGLAWLALPASFLNPFYWIFPAIAAVVAVARLR